MVKRGQSMRLATIAFAVAALAAQAAPLNNPLLQKGLPIPFDQIRAEHVEPAITHLLEEARQRRDAFVASPGPRTYENTMAAFEKIVEDLQRGMTIVRHLEGVASTPALRAAVNAVLPKYTEFVSGLPLDRGVYGKIKEYSETEEARALTGPRKRFLEVTLDEFRRAGAELSDKEQARLREINVEMSRLRKQFADNVLDATNEFELVITDEGKLAGLPESAKAAARESARQKGIEGWRFTLQQPSYTAVMTYLDDAAIRERMFRAYNTRAAASNLPVMKRILELRRERARILGFKNYADLVTADRMAKNGERVREFLRMLEDRTREFYEQENAELIEFRRSLEGPNAPPPPCGTWPITPRSCARRATISTTKRCAPISPSSPFTRACSNWLAVYTASGSKKWPGFRRGIRR